METQLTGGRLIIPDGYYVYRVDLDCEEPYCEIAKDEKAKDEKASSELEKHLIPKSLAYYLKTHFCGSRVMREHTYQDGYASAQSDIKTALGIKD